MRMIAWLGSLSDGRMRFDQETNSRPRQRISLTHQDQIAVTVEIACVVRIILRGVDRCQLISKLLESFRRGEEMIKHTLIQPSLHQCLLNI